MGSSRWIFPQRQELQFKMEWGIRYRVVEIEGNNYISLKILHRYKESYAEYLGKGN